MWGPILHLHFKSKGLSYRLIAMIMPKLITKLAPNNIFSFSLLFEQAEVERGDAPSSIMCYMAEANVTEEIATDHMKEIIGGAWRKINMELINANAKQKTTFVNFVINMARVCHFIYNKGDGFSVQDGDTKKQIKLLLTKPLQL